MLMKNYLCECGLEFDNPNSFNGHKSHCKTHQIKKHGSLVNLNARYSSCTEMAREALNAKRHHLKKMTDDAWAKSQKICENCGIIMLTKYGTGRFCCRSCANKRSHSSETKNKISKSLSNDRNFSHKRAKEIYEKNPNICIVCKSIIPYDKRHRKTCGNDNCKTVLFQNAGKNSSVSNSNLRRSKNEIYFYELCKKHFHNVRHNEPMFNGWDADIIIDDIKIAVLWNGAWHYSKLFENQKCSLKQIQNRDKIKIKEILSKNYTPYIIKDMGKYSKTFVEDQFDIFLNSIDKTN